MPARVLKGGLEVLVEAKGICVKRLRLMAVRTVFMSNTLHGMFLRSAERVNIVCTLSDHTIAQYVQPVHSYRFLIDRIHPQVSKACRGIYKGSLASDKNYSTKRWSV